MGNLGRRWDGVGGLEVKESDQPLASTTFPPSLTLSLFFSLPPSPPLLSSPSHSLPYSPCLPNQPQTAHTVTYLSPEQSRQHCLALEISPQPHVVLPTASQCVGSAEDRRCKVESEDSSPQPWALGWPGRTGHSGRVVKGGGDLSGVEKKDAFRSGIKSFLHRGSNWLCSGWGEKRSVSLMEKGG